MSDNIYKLPGFLFFTCIAEPTFKYQSKIEKEFKTTLVVDKATARQFTKEGFNKTVKQTPTEEFEAKFKTAPPYPDQEDQYSISFTAPATYKDGNPRQDWTFPKAYFKSESGEIVENSATLIGNGSEGIVGLRINTPNEKSMSTKPSLALKSVLITNLIPYEKKGAGDEWADEGVVRHDLAKDDRELPTPSSTTQHPSMNKPPVDDDLPF